MKASDALQQLVNAFRAFMMVVMAHLPEIGRNARQSSDQACKTNELLHALAANTAMILELLNREGRLSTDELAMANARFSKVLKPDGGPTSG